ncbi:site-determining protein [Clostridia bacterium]|nr:site-determining protein [Clostridia bacterium]
MARRIVITSGKGGVGKTTVTANLGAALAAMDLKVVLLDLDLGLNNLDVVTGIDNRIVYDIIDVIEGRCRLKQALVQDTRYPRLHIMPSAHSYDRSHINGQNVRAVCDRLSESFDYILLDCPAGIDVGFHRSVAAAGEALVVTTPHLSAIRDADKVLSILRGYALQSVEVIVNRARGDLMLNYESLDVEDIANLLKIFPLAVIPDDDGAAAMSAFGGTADRDSEAYAAFRILAQNLHHGTKLFYDCTERYRGFLGRLKRNLRKRV